MSNSLAIAAVTRTLRTLLDGITSVDYTALPNDARPAAQIEVTTLPPDRVRNGDSSNNRLNLYLYKTELNDAWRNMDISRRTRPGESSLPPLGLDLFYLLSAYAENNNELIAQVLLGGAMRILHDNPILSRADIRDSLALSELDSQIERVRIRWQPVSLDDLSKLWTGFQSDYRLSAAYQVAVVLIESERPRRAALPVLRRGGSDEGAFVVAAPAPTLLEVKEFFDPDLPQIPPYGKPAAELGDVIVLGGSEFGSEPMVARFFHLRLDAPLTLPLAAERSSTEVQVRLPQASDPGVPAAWPAGFYTVDLEVQRPDLPTWTTNRLPFGLAPKITGADPSSATVGDQPFDLTVTCRPQVLEEQRVVLLLGDREIEPTVVTTPPDPDADTTLVFSVEGMTAGAHVLRLRVDGADSIPVDFTAATPAFDANQTVTITP